MNCVAFERWLDEGDVAQVPAEHAAHMAACARCTRALAHARALESALGTHFSIEPAEPPTQFTAHVLERIEALEAKRAPILLVSDALPWWVRVAAEPTVIGASLIAAAWLWQGETIVALTRAALTSAAPPAAPTVVHTVQPLTSGLESLWAAFKPLPDASWAVAIAIALGLAPLCGLAGYGLWTLVERWVGSSTMDPRLPQRSRS